MDKIRLSVLGLSYNHNNSSGAYALVLSEEDGDRRIPIVIGGVEAQAIAIQLEGLTPPRPLTHDLFVSFASAFDIKLEEVYIYRLKDGIFYSELVCYDHNMRNKVRIDSRTSDAVALALRFHVPIYTSAEIMEKAGIIINLESGEESDAKTDMSSEMEEEFGLSEKTEQPDYTELDNASLREHLKKAIQNEDYEKASKIRDELKRRKSE